METKSIPKKKRFSVLGGGEIQAENADEIVEALRALAFAKYRTADDYMYATAEHCKTQTGAKVDIFNSETFVRDLIRHGFLAPVEP